MLSPLGGTGKGSIAFPGSRRNPQCFQPSWGHWERQHCLPWEQEESTVLPALLGGLGKAPLEDAPGVPGGSAPALSRR